MARCVAGFDPRASIPEFLAELPGGLDDRWVVITCLDSGPPSPESLTIRRAVATFADEVQWEPAGLLVKGARLRDVACDALFHGFDEVVVFKTEPVALAPPRTTFTSDRSLSAHARSGLLAYLETVGALAAAGDGSGLNCSDGLRMSDR